MSDAEGTAPSATSMAGVQRRKGTAAPVTEQEEEALGCSWDQLSGLVCPTDSIFGTSADRECSGVHGFTHLCTLPS